MNIKSNEKKENSAIELVIEVSAAEFEAALDKAYNKQKKNIALPGFRKGKAPRKMVEKMYGAEVFYEDAIEEAYPAAYEAALKEAGIEPVAYPKLEVVEVGPNGFTFKALVTVKPEASIKGYKGMQIAKPAVKVTAADVKAELQHYVNRASRLVSVERKAKKGDVAVIDFEGFRDGVPFDGGKDTGFSLELGSGTFVPGFEEQVIGMKAGEEKDIDITFPENYTPELAGAAVVFKVKVNEVKERQEPTVDDEFAKDVSEFDTLDELKKDISEKLKVQRQEKAEQDYDTAVMDALIEKLECDVPQAMVDYYAEKLLEDYARHMESQGLRFEQYLQMVGIDMETMRAQAKLNADRSVRSMLALEAVAAAEGIEITEADMDARVAEMAELYRVPADEVRAAVDMGELKDELLRKKALEVVKTSVKKPAAKKAEKKEEKVDEEPKKATKKTAKKDEQAAEEPKKKPAAKKTKKAEEKAD